MREKGSMSWGKVNGTLTYRDFAFACEFKRVKYLRLKLNANGEFKLTVPFGYTQKAVVEFLDKNNALFQDGEKRLSDGTIVAITLMVAESKAEEKDVMIKLIMNLLKL